MERVVSEPLFDALAHLARRPDFKFGAPIDGARSVGPVEPDFQVGARRLPVAAVPVSAVLYKCLVTETDIPYHLKEGPVHIPHLMKIRLLKTYPPDQFTFDILGREYGIFAVRGPRGIPASLSEALNAGGEAADT